MFRVGVLIAISLVMGGCVTVAQRKTPELPITATEEAFGHTVPPGAPVASQKIVSSSHPGVHQQMAKAPWRVANFRPNLNMPEFLNSDMINDTLTEQKAADIQRRLSQGKTVLMTFPRITLIPCDEGCLGNKDYEKMAERFLRSYESMAISGAGAYRGVMKIKVRWFRKKSFIENINPLSFSQQAFGIQFPIEGNMLTLSSSSFGAKASLEDCVDDVANKFKMGVIFPMALGMRNYFTITLDPNYDPSVMNYINNSLAAPVRGVQDLLGQTDYSSRLEPITSAHQILLPAIDGLQAGEGIDIGKGKLFNSF